MSLVLRRRTYLLISAQVANEKGFDIVFVKTVATHSSHKPAPSLTQQAIPACWWNAQISLEDMKDAQRG